ncbi:MAG TPA: transglutaminase-like domain-containing protein [Synergistaceae bacterium]|nr:transglutaminase-like domain-containing protein [Synergistaceae bacterium]
MEKELLRRMPLSYCYSHEKALRILRDALVDFKDEELESLRDNNAVEWIYIRGQVHYKNDFLENLFKTRKDYADRAKDPSERSQSQANAELLDTVIKKIKQKGAVTYRHHIRTTLTISPEAERIGEPVRVYIPIPVACENARNVTLLETAPQPRLISPPEYPLQTVCFETMLEKGQVFSVEYEFESHIRYQKLDPAEVLQAQPTFYTEEQLPHIWMSPYLRSLAAEITAGCKDNPLQKARRIYDYITTHVKYSYVRPYFTLTNIPDYVATGFKGDCGVQALLFITLCRICGIPARWQSGLYSTRLNVGNHDWAQFYIAPYGWLFADCSFGGGAYRRGAMDRWNFYFGHLDPFRVPTCSEFQHELLPACRFIRSDPYDNQVGEVEYQVRGLISDEFDTRHTLVSIEELD